MEYKIVYNNIDIITYTENIETMYTHTLETVFIGEIDEAISFFRKKNVNYSVLVNDFEILEKELFSVDISGINTTSGLISRNVVVIDIPIDLGLEVAYTTMKIKTDSVDIEDITQTFKISNETIIMVDGVEIGEFNYFYDLVMVQNIALPIAITNQILDMDSRSIFG